MKLAGIYGSLVGLLMAAQWTFFLLTGQVPELVTEPARIAFHLAAEFVTALGLCVASVGLLRGAAWGKPAYLFFAGLLTYSVIASPGYFAQQGQLGLVVMFGVLLALAVISVIQIGRQVE